MTDRRHETFPIRGIRYYTPPASALLVARDGNVSIPYGGIPIPLLEEDFAALDEARAKEPVYAGVQACSADCHGDVIELRAGSKHAEIGCETCHGPAAAHVADYEKVKPTKPDPATVCLICHSPNVAKPAFMKQVDPKDHADGSGACGGCHDPHSPDKEPPAAPAEGAKKP